MQAFKTTLTNFSFPCTFSQEDTILSMGSCFAQHIADKLDYHKFSVALNPFGILFNPLSLAKSLTILKSEHLYTEEDLSFDGELWHSFDHHGAYSDETSIKSLQKINKHLEKVRLQLPFFNRIILTFGTAYTWMLKDGDRLVANCHKFPKTDFDRRLIGVEEIVSALSSVLKSWKQENEALECLISVSPVRHLRDGMVNNQRSKATLLLAAHEIVENLDFVHYFPSYELFMDDLRDYRFYADDLIHPSKMGIDYVWNYFQENLLDKKTKEGLKLIHKIKKAVGHRPLFPNSKAHEKFRIRTLQLIIETEQKHPEISFEEEKNLLNKNYFDEAT